MKSAHHNAGITLVEVLVTIAIFGALAALTFPSYASIQTNLSLQNASREVVDALRAAQVRSMNSQDDASHGLRITASEFSRLTVDRTGAVTVLSSINLESGVAFSLPGPAVDVVFSRLIGATTPQTLTLETSGGLTTTVTIDAGGRIDWST